LLSYGRDQVDTFRRAAAYVDRILRGAKPAELPVQMPTKFEMAVNLKTAKALGLIIRSGRIDAITKWTCIILVRQRPVLVALAMASAPPRRRRMLMDRQPGYGQHPEYGLPPRADELPPYAYGPRPDYGSQHRYRQPPEYGPAPRPYEPSPHVIPGTQPRPYARGVI
jgi:hypothetical protein